MWATPVEFFGTVGKNTAKELLSAGHCTWMCLAPVRSCSSSRYVPSSRSRGSSRRIVYPPTVARACAPSVPTPRVLVLAISSCSSLRGEGLVEPRYDGCLMLFTPNELEFLRSQRIARVATIGPSGWPHVV